MSVRDITPTVLSLAHVQLPGLAQTPATGEGAIFTSGKSLVPILSGSADDVRAERDAIAWELFFRRGIRLGQWKAVYRNADSALTGVAGGASRWSLFNLHSDPGESADLSSDHPAVLDRLIAAWDAYARANGVFVPTPHGK